MANKTTVLSAQVNGNTHEIEITNVKKQYFVKLDGQDYNTFEIGKNSFGGGHHEDFSIEIEGIGFILAVRGKVIQLVCDGRYAESGKAFIRARPVPTWTWVFVFLNVLIFFFVAGGAIGGAFAGGGAYGCIAASRHSESRVKNILVCMALTIGCWVGAAVVAGYVYLLLA